MSGQVNYLENAPRVGQIYYFLSPDTISFYFRCKWFNTSIEKRWLSLHRVYPTKEDVERAIEFVKDYFISHKEQLNYITSKPETNTIVWYGVDMDDSRLDGRYINFDYKDPFHRRLLNEFRLFRTREDVIKASNLITEALEKEYKKAH